MVKGRLPDFYNELHGILLRSPQTDVSIKNGSFLPTTCEQVTATLQANSLREV